MALKKADSVMELANLYFIYGEEDLLVERSLGRLKSLFSREADPDFNMRVMSVPETGAQDIIEAAQTVPLLSSRRLVIVRDVDRLNKKEQAKLAEYVEMDNPETTLVLVARSPGHSESSQLKKIESSPLFKVVSRKGQVVRLKLGGRGKQAGLDSWVTDEFKKRGKRIEPDARELLLTKAGTGLRELADAVERVCLYSSDEKVVGREAVSEAVAPLAEQGVFEFVDAVAGRRRDLSLYLLDKLVMQGESPERLFNLLVRQFRLLARTKALVDSGSASELASRLGVHPFVAKKCLEQSKRFSADRLRHSFGELRKAQVELRTSSFLGEREYESLVLEKLVSRIIG